MIKKYGFEDGKRGLEAYYERDGDVLSIKMPGSNHKRDYLDNLFAWPRVKIKGCKYHRKWYDMARKFADHLIIEYPKFPPETVIMAHSMAGAVAAILPTMLPTKCRIWSINAPKVGDKAASGLTDSLAHYRALYDRGDIVRFLPLFYSRYKTRIQYASTHSFWRAHNNLPPLYRRFLNEDYRPTVLPEDMESSNV